MNCTSVGKRTLVRLPLYLSYLRSADIIKQHNISATAIANALCLNQVQVRKDLAKVSGRGKPKVGYETHELVARLEQFLGYDNVDSAVLVGAGHLGKALLSYDGFSQYGLKIVAAFDCDSAAVCEQEGSIPILPFEKLPDFILRMKIKLAIITVPAKNAQDVCNALVASGILAIWNFAPIMLSVPDGIMVQNENMAASLAVLSNHLSTRMNS